MQALVKSAFVLFFWTIINLKFKHRKLQGGLLSNYEHSFIRIKKNAWDIVNVNHEIFNSPGKRANEVNFSDYKWNIYYDQPFSSQISQVILIVLAIVILICIILSIICCYYSVPKEEDFTKKDNGIYYFENENRPEEFAPIYHKSAQNRRYLLTGEAPKNVEYEDQD